MDRSLNAATTFLMHVAEVPKRLGKHDMRGDVGNRVVEYGLKAFLPYAPSGSLVVISPALLVAALSGAVILGVISGIYPAWGAASMRPVEAIQRSEELWQEPL